MSHDLLLNLKDLACGYASQKVVQDLDLHLNAGDIGCLLGPSGCGKTTTLRAIAGFEPVLAGQIELGGEVISRPGFTLAPEKRRIGMVFQDYALFPHLSVADNVGFGIRKHPQRERLVRELLELVKLDHLAARHPHELSGGQQQRVALARALAPEPLLLLLDEPFSNLDVELRRSLSQEVREILKARGTSAILVTHDQEEAMTMAQRIAIMHLGCIEQIGSPMDIYETPASRLVCEFIGNVNLFDGVLVEDVQDHAVIACPQLENPIYIGHGISTRAEDKRITYALRPEKVMISAQKPDNLEHAGHNWAQGTVYDIAYLGGHSVYYIKLASGMIVQAFMANAERHVARPTWDQSVYISWYDDSGVVLQS